jgi:hypothetical protein
LGIRNSVVAVVSAAIQNGVIISIDFLEPSPMCPRSEMVQWYINPHTNQLLSVAMPDAYVKVTCKYSLDYFRF